MEVLVFATRQCGTRQVYCDGNCKGCVLRQIKTEDGEYLYTGEVKDGDGK